MAPKSSRPKLSVIETPPTGFEPSSNTAGAKLWRKIQAEHQFRRAGDVALLIEACIMLDRAEQLAECIAQDGPTFKIGGIPKSHPSLRDEIQCRAFVTRTLARLGAVGTDAKKRPPGRPPSAAVGITYEQLQRLQEDGDEIVP